MTALKLRFRSTIPAPASNIYDWHARPGAFERLTPPWQGIETADYRGAVEVGDWRLMRFYLGPVSLNWLALHRENIPGRMFADEQVYGPFRSWRHVHRFDATDAENTALTDELTIELPVGPLAYPLAGPAVRSVMCSTFRFRHLRTRLDVMRHRNVGLERQLRVAILGEGIVAEQLASFLTAGGHDVDRLTGLSGAQRLDAVVDLRELESAGGLAPRPAGTDSEDTGHRVPACVRVVPPSRASDTAGNGVVAIRQVALRTGVVLTAAADPLSTWLRRARFGLPVDGTGGSSQVTWIALDDLLAAILIAIADESVRDEVDVMAPGDLTGDSLNATLQSTMFPAALLAPIRARQGRPQRAGAGGSHLPGFRFAFPTIERLVRFETGRG